MLLDGKEMYKNGTNVLLGVIDTHGRVETAKLTEGLPTLPPKLIEHKFQKLFSYKSIYCTVYCITIILYM